MLRFLSVHAIAHTSDVSRTIQILVYKSCTKNTVLRYALRTSTTSESPPIYTGWLRTGQQDCSTQNEYSGTAVVINTTEGVKSS